MKSLFEFSNIIVVEAVDVEVHHANDFVVIFGSHRSLPLARLEHDIERMRAIMEKAGAAVTGGMPANGPR